MKRSIDKHGELVITCGLSGAGKSTLVRHALSLFSDQLEYMNTYTTRPRRTGEDEVEYTFVRHGQYDRLKRTSERWDESVLYGNYYGLDPDLYLEKMARGSSIIVCSVPSEEVIGGMKELYGKDRTKVVHLATDSETSKEYLKARGISSELGRAAIDMALLQDDRAFSSDYTLTPSGKIEQDKVRFSNLIGEIINA